MSLYTELSKISTQIHTQRHLMDHNEDATILVSIQPFIRALGYDTQNLLEVFPQYNADAKTTGGEKVDYAIFRDAKPIIFIEAKAANISLNESNWKQLYNYFNAEDVRFAILSNGIEYRFYTDLKKRNVMDKQPFLSIHMLDLDERLVNELEGFTKSGFDRERIIAGAQRRVMARLLRQGMEKPSHELIKLFARQVQSGRLGAAEIQRYSRLLTEAWRELVEEEIAKRLQSAVESNSASDKTESEGTDAPKRTPPQTTGRDIPVIGYYEGHRFEAELLRNTMGRGLQIARHHIRYNGKSTWLKNAAVMAIRSVDPSFQPTRTYPNGFTFWYVVDPADGKEHMIRYISGWEQTDEALRQRVLDMS